jgi:hypothetical protein
MEWAINTSRVNYNQIIKFVNQGIRLNRASQKIWSAGYRNVISTAFPSCAGQKDFILSNAPPTAMVSAYPTPQKVLGILSLE